jgi:hypothetical protein
MANPRIPYRFSNDGPTLKAAPAGAIMVHLVVNVEHWQFESSMPRTIITPPHGKETVPDVPNFSWADYGMRAGLPRILRAIQDRGLPASTSFNAGVITAYPQAAQASEGGTEDPRAGAVEPQRRRAGKPAGAGVLQRQDVGIHRPRRVLARSPRWSQARFDSATGDAQKCKQTNR